MLCTVKKGMAAFLAVCLICCAEETPKIQKVTDAEKAEIRAIADRAAGTLLKTLQTELLSAIQKEGVTGAIDVCRMRAIHLTDSLAGAMERVEKIKRTSTKIRNPLNRADRFERDALQYFAKKNGDPQIFSEVYIQKLSDQAGTYYRYYKPLQVKALCLSCHGPRDAIDSDLAGQLAKNYPQDTATDYQIDDFRGVISVTIR